MNFFQDKIQMIFWLNGENKKEKRMRSVKINQIIKEGEMKTLYLMMNLNLLMLLILLM